MNSINLSSAFKNYQRVSILQSNTDPKYYNDMKEKAFLVKVLALQVSESVDLTPVIYDIIDKIVEGSQDEKNKLIRFANFSIKASFDEERLSYEINDIYSQQPCANGGECDCTDEPICFA